MIFKIRSFLQCNSRIEKSYPGLMQNMKSKYVKHITHYYRYGALIKYENAFHEHIIASQ